MLDDSLLKIEPLLKRSNSMFLHPSPDIDLKVLKQIGDYTLGTELGSGAFGKVVLGKHIYTNEPVAIKILDKMILSHTPDDYQSVRQEINILKSVKHKHIVQLYDVLQTPRHIFIIMEYCEGKDLLDYILTKSKLSEEESLKYFHQLINALFYLHSQNIAHRDIKIDNMLLDRNRDLKLVDFGLSTKYPDDNLLDQPCGTVVYAAPEVLQGREYHGMLADVWSSGIVLYGMLSGYLPFGEQDDEINRINIISGKINYPNYFSTCVKDLLMHMLDLDPMTRYTLQEVRSHPWFNLIDYKLIPGIIIGYNLIPVDEKILDLCVTYNCDREKVKESVINNKYNSDSALYYLLIKKLQKKGLHSVSDFCSDEFINFILDDNNLIDEKNDNRNKKEVPESEIKYNVNINAINNCSAPPDGKLKEKNEKKNNEDFGLDKVNKKINFEEESSKGALSYIINSPSFEETNKELFNQKSNNSIGNKELNIIDLENKKTNKNSSSDSKKKTVVLQQVTVNAFQIIDVVHHKKDNNNNANIDINKQENELEENKINNNNLKNEISPNKESNINNNMEIQDDEQNEKDYKILNVFYNNTENSINNNINENNIYENRNLSINNNEIIYISSSKKDKDKDKDKNIDYINSKNLNPNISNSIHDNSIEIITNRGNENKNNVELLHTPVISPIQQQDNNGKIKEILIHFDRKRENQENIKNNNSNIETPKNKILLLTNNKNINEDKNTSKNTLSKQKVYIDKTKTYSEKNKHENNKNIELNLNRIKDIRKINLFQDEIKEENNEPKPEQIDIKISDNKLNKENSPIKSQNKNIIEDISLVDDSNDLIDKNNIIENVIASNDKQEKEKENEIDKEKEKEKKKEIEKKKEQENQQDNINIIKVEKKDIEIKPNEVKKITSVEKSKKKQVKNNKKITKKKDNNGKNTKIKNIIIKMKNPLINSIMKNYKSIIENNKSVELKKKQKNSLLKDKNSYSAKHRMKKNKEKEIISIKVEINKELKSKEKNKFRNSILNNRTEQQNRKMMNIYGMGIMPTNLSKNKYTIANKMSNNKSKPNSSLIKRNIIKSNYTTNRKISTNNKENNKTHLKSSSIQLFNTAIKNTKYVSKYTSTFNNSKSYVSKINNLIKTKKKTSNQKYNNNKSLIKNNFLVNSYNNKYMKLFRSTQYKNNNLFFTKKIDKTNLNKKFNEIAHKINKNNKINLNGNINNFQNKNNKQPENKKIPLWKYIQSDINKTNNSSATSIINNKEIKKKMVKNPISKKIIKEIKPKIVINKSSNNQKNIKPNKFIDTRKLINVNKMKSTSKEKNINLIFINIKNYINERNIKNHNYRYLESSASNHKYKSTFNYRDLSESVKNKNLNKKTRFMRIPWKIIKKSIDEKLKLDELYKSYLIKSQNPFKNNNSKINKLYNIKPIQNNYQKKILV